MEGGEDNLGLDVWSLGRILAELSSGYVLFQVWGGEGPARE